MTSPSWVLSAHPVSGARKAELEQLLGTPFVIASIADLRAGGLIELVRSLFAVRAAEGYVHIQDDDSAPLLPILRLLVAATRCRRLSVISSQGRPQPYQRLSVIVDAWRLLAGSLRGFAAAARCWAELKRLRRLSPLRPQLRQLRAVVYLKTNLWFGVKAGGSVGHVAGIANALATRCSRVDLLSVEQPPLLAPTVRCHVVSSPGGFGFPFELNFYVFERLFVKVARQLLEDHPPDLIYQRLSLANHSGVPLARALGVPLVVEYNGSEVWVSRHWGRPLHFPTLAEAAEDTMLQHADLVVTVSDVLGDELRARGVSPERILVHPNCVDPDRFNPDQFSVDDRNALLDRYGISRSAVVCGFIGTFGMWHGVPLLAKAIRQMVESDRAWMAERRVHFMLVGDGIMMSEVNAILDVPEAKRFVTLTGLVEQREAPRYLAACDILVSPHVPNADGSRFFGSPTKLFEYMAMGRAIVASDLDQIGQVLTPGLRASALSGSLDASASDGKLAILVEPGSCEQLIDAIRFLVEHPGCRAALGRHARQRALARYTWGQNVDAVLERLRSLAGSPQSVH